MSEPHLAIVIKPDGVVPFDKGLARVHRDAMLAYLLEDHTVQHNLAPHPEHGGESHAVLLTGPHCKASQDARRAAEAQPGLNLPKP